MCIRDRLSILDVNIWVILILMIGVAGFTMVSGLLIIIIERTSCLLYTSLIGLMIAIGISIPARKAMKVQPAEALHDE